MVRTIDMFSMMFCVSFVLLFYMGWVVGLKLQCENLSILKNAKQITPFVPFIQIYLALDSLMQSIKKKEVKHFIKFVLQPHKSIVVLSFYAKNAKKSESGHYSILLTINHTKKYIENDGDIYLIEKNDPNPIEKDANTDTNEKSIIHFQSEKTEDLTLYDNVYFTLLADCMDYYATTWNDIAEYKDDENLMALMICNRLINCIKDNHSYDDKKKQYYQGIDFDTTLMILGGYIQEKRSGQYGIHISNIYDKTNKSLELSTYSILRRSWDLPYNQFFKYVKKEDIIYQTLDIINQTTENKTNTYEQIDETIEQLKYRYYQSAGIVQMLLDYQMGTFEKNTLMTKIDINNIRDSKTINREYRPICVFLPQLSKADRSSQIEGVVIHNEKIYPSLFTTMKEDINDLDIIMKHKYLNKVEKIQDATIEAQRLTTILSTLNSNCLYIGTDQGVFSDLLYSTKSILHLLRKAAMDNPELQYNEYKTKKKDYRIEIKTNRKFCTQKTEQMKKAKIHSILRECVDDEKTIDAILIVVDNHLVSRDSLESSYQILRNVSDSQISLIVDIEGLNKQ